MEKIYRFAAKNKRLFAVISSVFLCGVYTTFFTYLGLPLWMIIFVNLMFLFISWAYPTAARSKLMDKAVAALDQQCDPEPLLQEVQTQLTYRNAEAQEQLLLVNKSAALGMLGQHQQAYDILKTINIDKCAATLPPTKLIYYNNLSSECGRLGDIPQAKIWNAKACQMYEDMKEGKPKQSLRYQYQMLQADSCFMNGEYEKALELAKVVPAVNLYQQVCKARFCGELQLKLGNLEAAKADLQFVIANGNRLHGVTEARERIAQYGL